jgi:hypothetical protein
MQDLLEYCPDYVMRVRFITCAIAFTIVFRLVTWFLAKRLHDNGRFKMVCSLPVEWYGVVVLLLIVHIPLVLETQARRESIMTHAIHLKNPNMVHDMLGKGVDPNSKIDGDPLLVRAAGSGAVEIVNLLLEHGARANVKSSEGHFILYGPLIDGNDRITRILVKAGAETNFETSVTDYSRLNGLYNEYLYRQQRYKDLK